MASVERIHRLLRLAELLHSGRTYNAPQLADQCAVSRRTVFRDLKMLQMAGLPIVYDKQKQGYSLSGSSLLPPTDFTVRETLSMLVLCHELGDDARGIPFQGHARSAAVKLLSSLPSHLREYVGELTESISLRIDPHNPLEGWRRYYVLLADAVRQRRQVRIDYHSLADEQKITTLLSGYRILFNRRSWYVIGRSSLHRAIRTFNIGRIGQAEMLKSHYEMPPRFNLDRHLGNAWSLIREPGKRCDVVVRFQKMVARNVAEVHWHKTQKTVWNQDGTLDFRVTVDGLGEIIWWILGYGDQAEVIKPRQLRNEIKKRIAGMQAMYA
jgi:proteasome accessory factor B